MRSSCGEIQTACWIYGFRLSGAIDDKDGQYQNRACAAKKYVTSFLWIPLGFPSLAVTEGFNNRPDAIVYTDYEYFSVFGGIFQSVGVVTYDEKTNDQ